MPFNSMTRSQKLRYGWKVSGIDIVFITYTIVRLTEAPVRITVPLPQTTTILEGDTTTLQAEVSKEGAETAWFKDDLEILPDVDEKFDIAIDGAKHSLTIRDATIDDEAEYTIEVGTESSTGALLVDGMPFLSLPEVTK